MSEKNRNDSAACTADCSSCGQECPSRQAQGGAEAFPKEPLHPRSRVKHVIGVVSGKGGVGKSTTSALLAVAMSRLGYKAGILDADITGPSIPRLFGLEGHHAMGDGEVILPATTPGGIEIISINMLLQNETDPVVWRGPVIGGTIKQFWGEVLWQDVDYLFIDMPPGTGDVPLTVFQSLPVNGIVVVTSPQQLVGMVVSKAVNMARLMQVPVLGLVENMAFVECPDCGKKIPLFGESHTAEICAQFSLPLLASLPIDPALAALADSGKLEQACVDKLEATTAAIERL